MQADGDELLSDQEKQQLVKVLEALIELRNGDDVAAIEQGIKDTDKASKSLLLVVWINRFELRYQASR